MKARYLIGAALLLLASQSHSDTPKWPEWVLDPQSVANLAGSDCVAVSGSMSIDRQQVLANARLALAQQISVKIQALDKTYSQRVSEGKAVKLSSSFESSSQQPVDTALNGVKTRFMEQVKNSDGRFLCALVVLEDDSEKQLAKTVSRSVPGAPQDAQAEEILLAAFRERAQQGK